MNVQRFINKTVKSEKIAFVDDARNQYYEIHLIFIFVKKYKYKECKRMYSIILVVHNFFVLRIKVNT